MADPCDLVKNEYIGDGSTNLFSFTFEYDTKEEVHVALRDPTTEYFIPIDRNRFTFVNATTVALNVIPEPVKSRTGLPRTNVRIFRATDLTSMVANFYPGSAIRAQDLNDDFEQLRLAILEGRCTIPQPILDFLEENYWDKNADTIYSNENWVSDNSHVASTAAIDKQIKAESAASDAPNDGSIYGRRNSNWAKVSDNFYTESELKNGVLDTRYYTESELNNGQLDNRYYTESEVNNTFYTKTELNNGQLNTLYYTESELNNGQLDNRYFTETELKNGALDSRYFTETELKNGALDSRYYTETELKNGALDSRYYTESESNNRFWEISEAITSDQSLEITNSKLLTAAGMNKYFVRSYVQTLPPTEDIYPGDLWYDSTSGTLYFYYDDGNSTQWVSIVNKGEKGESFEVYFSVDPPIKPKPSMLWFNTARAQLYTWYDDGNSKQWVSVSSQIPSVAGYGDVALRPSEPVRGQMYYNTSSDNLEIYSGTTWINV
jgi:hypothetical protein